jgi:hypothetical protein
VTEYDHIPIETTEGHRPPSSSADRLLIGLASLALFGGFLVAVSNFVSDDPVSVASASPAPSASRTPQPSPTPRPRLDVAVVPGQVPSPSPEQSSFYGWIRANTDLMVRADPRADAREVAVLSRGAVAQVDENSSEAHEPGWLYVNDPGPAGWIATMDGDTSLVQRYSTPESPYSGYIWTLAAGHDGFVAIGSPPFQPGQPSRPMAMTSTDGARWRASELPAGWGQWGESNIAWGPVGWLAVTHTESPTGPTAWVWRSADGLDWSALGSMPNLPANSYVVQLVASERGYLLATVEQRASLWFSTDGDDWHETDEPGPEIAAGYSLRLAATSAGFFAWNDTGGSEARQAAFSIDGQTWSAVDGGPQGPNRRFVGVNGRIVGMDADPLTGSPRFWTGSVARGRVAWLRQSQDDARFGDAIASTLVTSGQRAMAFGWDRASETPLVWSGDGSRWTQYTLPSAFNGVPRMAAAGAAGFVVVGNRPTLRGPNPTFWHEVAMGRWQAEESPLFDVVPDPAPADCGPPPADAVEFMVLDVSAASACFSEVAITLRFWSTRCDGCMYGGDVSGAEPAWLVRPTNNVLYVSPIESESSWGQVALLPPTIELDRDWTAAWLDVTGHFDDPAAATCRFVPPPADVEWYAGYRDTIASCRQQFVVSKVTVAEGP